MATRSPTDLHVVVRAVRDAARIILAGLTFALASCAAPSVPYTEVKVGQVVPATVDQVKACTYLDDIIGTSAWYGVFASRGTENARTEALAKARSIGATHIVWQPRNDAYGVSSVAGKAYRCGG